MGLKYTISADEKNMNFSKKWVRLSIVFSIVGFAGILLAYLWHTLFGHNSEVSLYLWIGFLVISVLCVLLGIAIIPFLKLRCSECGKSTPKLHWNYTTGFCPGCGKSLECDFTKTN